MNATADNPAIRYLVGEDERPAEQGRGNYERPVFLDAYRMLHAKTEHEATFHGWRPTTTGRRIDYVFTMESNPEIQVREAEIIHDHEDSRYPSDHYPVQALLCLPGKPKD